MFSPLKQREIFSPFKILLSLPPSSRYIWCDHRIKKDLRDADVLFEIKYLLIRSVCAFFSFCVCDFIFELACSLWCFSWGQPPEKDHTSISLPCVSNTSSLHEKKKQPCSVTYHEIRRWTFGVGCLYFWNSLVWCEFAVFGLMFYFYITVVVSSACTQNWFNHAH